MKAVPARQLEMETREDLGLELAVTQCVVGRTGHGEPLDVLEELVERPWHLESGSC